MAKKVRARLEAIPKRFRTVIRRWDDDLGTYQYLTGAYTWCVLPRYAKSFRYRDAAKLAKHLAGGPKPVRIPRARHLTPVPDARFWR